MKYLFHTYKNIHGVKKNYQNEQRMIALDIKGIFCPPPRPCPISPHLPDKADKSQHEETERVHKISDNTPHAHLAGVFIRHSNWLSRA